LGLAGSAAADAKRMQNGAAVEANLTGYPAPIGRGRPRAFAGATEMIAIISAMPGEGWGRPVSRSGPASTGAGLVITTGYPFSRDVHSTYWIACHRSMSTCPGRSTIWSATTLRRLSSRHGNNSDDDTASWREQGRSMWRHARSTRYDEFSVAAVPQLLNTRNDW